MPPSLRETVMWTVFQDAVLLYVASTSAWSVHQTLELSVESVYYHWYLFITSDMDLRNMFCLDS